MLIALLDIGPVAVALMRALDRQDSLVAYKTLAMLHATCRAARDAVRLHARCARVHGVTVPSFYPSLTRLLLTDCSNPPVRWRAADDLHKQLHAVTRLTTLEELHFGVVPKNVATCVLLLARTSMPRLSKVLGLSLSAIEDPSSCADLETALTMLPSVQTLRLCIDYAPESLRFMTQVRDLSLECTASEIIIPPLGAFLPPNLVRLDIWEFHAFRTYSAADVIALARLPKLEHLRLADSIEGLEDEATEGDLGGVANPFPALETLTMGEVYPWVCDFIFDSVGDRLRALTLSTDDRSFPSTLSSLTGLTQLRMDGVDTCTKDLPALAGMTGLRSLCLRSGELDLYAVVDLLSTNWRGVEDLELLMFDGPRHDHEYEPPATVADSALRSLTFIVEKSSPAVVIPLGHHIDFLCLAARDFPGLRSIRTTCAAAVHSLRRWRGRGLRIEVID
jgi:hypothetical protein